MKKTTPEPAEVTASSELDYQPDGADNDFPKRRKL